MTTRFIALALAGFLCAQPGAAQAAELEAGAPLAAHEAAAPAASQAIRSRVESLSAEAENGLIRVTARALIAAPASAALETLSDFESHPSFLPALSVSIIRERQGDRFELEQVSTARAGPLSRSIRSIKTVRIDRAALSIESESTAQSPARSRSRLTLEPVEGGCVMRYEASAETPAWAPSSLARSVALSQARDQLSRLLAEIERRARRSP